MRLSLVLLKTDVIHDTSIATVFFSSMFKLHGIVEFEFLLGFVIRFL